MHLLLDFELLVNRRLRYQDAYQLEEPGLSKLEPRKILNFIKALGLVRSSECNPISMFTLLGEHNWSIRS